MFADSGLTDVLAEKVVAFVDREAGRDAPLTAADEAMVRRMIADNPAVRDLVDDLRATNAGLDRLLDDVAAVEVPDRLIALIRGHESDDVAVMMPAFDDGSNAFYSQDGDAGDVVAMQRSAPRRINYGPWAAAASIAFLISSGALVHLYNTSKTERAHLQAVLATTTEEAENQGRALADAKAELSRFALFADQASSQHRETAGRILSNEETIQQLEVERAELMGRYAALESENQTLSERLELQRSEVAEGETESQRLSTVLAEARQALAEAETRSASLQQTLTANVEEFEAKLSQRDQQTAALNEELAAGQQLAAATSADLAKVRDEQADLERRLAEAEQTKQQLQAAVAEADAAAANAEQRLASMEFSVEEARGRLATVVAGLTAAEEGRQEALRQVIGLEADLATRKNWLGQVAQYHRVYASTSRQHLVEVDASERDHIQQWLTGMVGREVVVPDLSAQGVTFAGARLLGIEGQPVAQLVYLDANDEPLALCIISATGAAKNPTLSINGDLNMVDWRDGRHAYAVVGWSDPELLNSLTAAIQPVYDL